MDRLRFHAWYRTIPCMVSYDTMHGIVNGSMNWYLRSMNWYLRFMNGIYDPWMVFTIHGWYLRFMNGIYQFMDGIYQFMLVFTIPCMVSYDTMHGIVRYHAWYRKRSMHEPYLPVRELVFTIHEWYLRFMHGIVWSASLDRQILKHDAGIYDSCMVSYDTMHGTVRYHAWYRKYQFVNWYLPAFMLEYLTIHAGTPWSAVCVKTQDDAGIYDSCWYLRYHA